MTIRNFFTLVISFYLLPQLLIVCQGSGGLKYVSTSSSILALVLEMGLNVENRIIANGAKVAEDEEDEYYDDEYYDDENENDVDTSQNKEDDEYYDDGYEDEEVNIGIDGSSMDEEEMPPNGYYQNVGGIKKVRKKLVDDLYLDESSKIYGCLRETETAHFNTLVTENVKTELDVLNEEEPRTQKSSIAEEENTGADVVNGEDTHEDESIKSSGSGVKPKIKKKKSYREIQHEKMEAKRKAKLERESSIPKYTMGADCETLICGSCKVLVYEFAKEVHQNINNKDIKYIDQLTPEFCKSRAITIMYNDIVTDICKNFELERLGYKEVLVSAFEEEAQWNNILLPEKILEKQNKVCTTVGACNEWQFHLQTQPRNYRQEHWDDKCFMCQNFARNLEEHIQLKRFVAEKNIKEMVSGTCERMQLQRFDSEEHQYHKFCDEMVNDQTKLDDMAWLGLVHSEKVLKGDKMEMSFYDKLCEEIDYCTAYISPEEKEEKEAIEQNEEMFY